MLFGSNFSLWLELVSLRETGAIDRVLQISRLIDAKAARPIFSPTVAEPATSFVRVSTRGSPDAANITICFGARNNPIEQWLKDICVILHPSACRRNIQ